MPGTGYGIPAEEFREARKVLGLSMAAASRRCKVPYRTWQQWEDGTNRVPNYAFCFLFYLRHTSATE
jgi:DNA-binding transcriptional regulator YiaG